MLNLVRLLPVALSLLLLGAHFYRAGWPAATLVCVGLLPLLVLRRWWVPSVFQALLVLAALERLRTLLMIALMRIANEQEWARMAIILGLVAAFTAASALVFRASTLQSRYDGDGSRKRR